MERELASGVTVLMERGAVVRVISLAGWDHEADRSWSAGVLGHGAGVEALRGQGGLKASTGRVAPARDRIDGRQELSSWAGHTDHAGARGLFAGQQVPDASVRGWAGPWGARHGRTIRQHGPGVNTVDGKLLHG